LRPHPQNWRRHPDAQREALRGLLAEIGYAGALLARELEGGGLELIDGQMRTEEATPDQLVPVLVLNVDADEAATLIATLDPIGAMAEANDGVLRELLATREPDDAALRRLFDDLATDLEGLGAKIGSEASGSGAGTISESEMELRPEEHYDYIVVCATNVNDWNRLVRLLDLPPVTSSRTHRRIGMARAVRAEKVLELMDHLSEKNKSPNTPLRQ